MFDPSISQNNSNRKRSMKKSSSVSRMRKGSEEALRFRRPGNNNLTGSMHENMDNNIEVQSSMHSFEILENDF